MQATVTPPGHVRGEDTAGVGQFVNKCYTCNSAVVSHWNGQGREGTFPHPPPEGGPLRALSPCPRSESAGGDSGSPDGNPPRRQERESERESGDEGGQGTFDRACPIAVAAADMGKTSHQPDDGRPEFTMVPSMESITRGSAAAPPTSARRESAVSGASHSTMPTSGADFDTRYAATHANQTSRKQSTPGPFN